jgi:hypothetical protein
LHEGARTPDEIRAILLELREESSLAFTRDTLRGEGEGDPEATWNALEVALGMMITGYLPRREAVAEVKARLPAWWTFSPSTSTTPTSATEHA